MRSGKKTKQCGLRIESISILNSHMILIGASIFSRLISCISPCAASTYTAVRLRSPRLARLIMHRKSLPTHQRSCKLVANNNFPYMDVKLAIKVHPKSALGLSEMLLTIIEPHKLIAYFICI